MSANRNKIWYLWVVGYIFAKQDEQEVPKYDVLLLLLLYRQYGGDVLYDVVNDTIYDKAKALPNTVGLFVCMK